MTSSLNFLLGTQAPIISLSPTLQAAATTGISTMENSVDASGTIMDATSVTVKINDETATVVGNSFSKRVDLLLG
jgi:hypothetical protein